MDTRRDREVPQTLRPQPEHLGRRWDGRDISHQAGRVELDADHDGRFRRFRGTSVSCAFFITCQILVDRLAADHTTRSVRSPHPLNFAESRALSWDLLCEPIGLESGQRFPETEGSAR